MNCAKFTNHAKTKAGVTTGSFADVDVRNTLF